MTTHEKLLEALADGDLHDVKHYAEQMQSELTEARRIAEAYRLVWAMCLSAVETCPNPDPLPWHEQ
jgi:hypothetical protein